MCADGVQHARAAGVAKVHRQVLRLARLQKYERSVHRSVTAALIAL